MIYNYYFLNIFFYFRVEVMNLDEKRQVKKIAKTGIMNISLSRGQEINILSLEKDFEYPMYIVICLLMTSKEKDKQDT